MTIIKYFFFLSSPDKTLALWLGNGDEHRPLESNTTGQKLSRGTSTSTSSLINKVVHREDFLGQARGQKLSHNHIQRNSTASLFFKMKYCC